MKNTQTNTGRLCSVYCPSCGKVTQKVSFNLLREAAEVKVVCPVCLEYTLIEYDGKTATVTHIPRPTGYHSETGADGKEKGEWRV
jgi:sarcosine oxidase delta subunit